MDEYILDVQSHLKLAEMTLRARLAWIERRPKGMLFRSNQAAHTNALLAMVGETRRMAELQADGWWEKDDQVPF